MALVKEWRGISLFLGFLICQFLALQTGCCWEISISSDPMKIGISQEEM
jgi:hypothetical protein